MNDISSPVLKSKIGPRKRHKSEGHNPHQIQEEKIKLNEDIANEMGIRAIAMKPLAMRNLAITVRKVLDEK